MTDNIEPPPRLRNARACEACRASKSRCVYKTQQEVCQKCEESGSQCIVRAKARPMRTRASRPFGVSNSSSDSKFLLDLPAVPSRDTHQDMAELVGHHKQVFGSDYRTESTAFHSSEAALQHNPVVQPLIRQRKITLSQAEDLLSSFREKAPFFPFVHVPLEATIPSMSRTSPFLLLALLTATSKSDPSLHQQLDHEFRRVLSQKIIVEGQKSLDFLQGLLVYIAWYPIHSNPKNNQSFVYMNLAVSLTVDLGLDEEVPNPLNFNAINTQGLIEGVLFTKAAKRAYLGCYYLSSALSLGFQKPNSIQYRNLMDSRGEELLQAENSSEIYYVVKLQRLWERIAELLFSKERGLEIHMQSLTGEMATQTFLNELEDYKRSTSDSVRNIGFIGLAERFVNVAIYSHRLGFLRRPYNNVLQAGNQEPGSRSSYFRCLDAAKGFFEYLLSSPESSFLNFTIVQWAQIVQTILVLSRLTFLMAADLGWDPDTTRANVPMVMYLDCLCWRFQKLSSTSADAGLPPQNPDSLYILKKIFESLKNSYERRVTDLKPASPAVDSGSAIGVARGHCPIHDPNLSMYFSASLFQGGNSLDQNVSMGSNNVPIYHDIWSTMTGNWAEE